MGLPLLSFDSLIETDDESSVNTRLGVMATVTNSGAGTANFMTDCTSDGVDANIGLTIGNTIGPGETIEIPLNWDSPIEGELTLDCEIFVPYQFEGYTVVSPASASSGVVVWTAADDDSSVNLAIPIAIGIVGMLDPCDLGRKDPPGGMGSQRLRQHRSARVAVPKSDYFSVSSI